MTPTVRISVGLVSITISLVFIAYSLGLIPNEQTAALETRARICENLAVQLASLVSRNDEAAIRDTVGTVLKRSRDLLSIGVRDADGKLLVDSGNHHLLWQEPAGGKSTDSFIQIPLMNGDAPQGKIEFVFRSLSAGEPRFGLSSEMAGVIGFIGFAGFVGYYLILSRVLRELDPGGAIPERVKAAFDTLAEGVLIMDERQYVLLVNDAFLKNIYTGADSLIGTDVSDLPWMPMDSGAPGDVLPWQSAMRDGTPVLGAPGSIRNPAGDDKLLIINATPIVDGKGGVRGAIATFDDVTVLHRTNQQLNESIDQLRLSQTRIAEQNRELQILASCDALTGCLNRRTFFAQAELMIEGARNMRKPMSLLMLDADHFKGVNDRFGHAVGDKVLVGLAGVMKRVCAECGLIGRYGGEEFCIVVDGLDEQAVQGLAEHLRQTVADTRTWLPNGEAITISIGIASLDAQCGVADLVKRADSALYTAKATGRNRFVTWQDVELLNGVPEQIRSAIRDRKLYCEFQPKVEISSRQVVGFEALVRWRSDRDHNHPTEEFIRQAVELGLINEVTHFVLATVIESIDRLDAVFGSGTTISINVAAKLANDMDFMTSFSRALRNSGIAHRIIVEMTEESFIKKGGFQAQIVPLLHELGVQVSIDDFGTGYSSLSVLADIMADEIKVDRSLISRIHERPRNQSILRAINSLGRSLNMNIVAEGVETFEELAYLQGATTIRQVQGFYFAKPFYLENIDSVKHLAPIGRGAREPAPRAPHYEITTDQNPRATLPSERNLRSLSQT